MSQILGKVAAMPLKVLWLVIAVVPGLHVSEWLMAWISHPNEIPLLP